MDARLSIWFLLCELLGLERFRKNGMKSWLLLMLLFLGLLYMFEPAWNVEATVRPQKLISEVIDCGEVICPSYVNKEQTTRKTIMGYVTCYTNIPELTDSSPDITASGDKVRLGGVAANGYRFGTRIRIAQEIYSINDRKNSRYGPEWFDIFKSDKKSALACGVKRLPVIVYENF